VSVEIAKELEIQAAQLGIVALAPPERHQPSKIHKMWKHRQGTSTEQSA
jgi:hypothetical protein